MRDESTLDLAAVPLFEPLSDRQRRLIRLAGTERDFAPGATVLAEGAPGDDLYVVLAGRAAALRRGRSVGGFGPGDVFGETAAVAGGPRTATVVAETGLRCLVVPRARLKKELAGAPRAAWLLLETLGRRSQRMLGEDQADGG
ncbi:MAG: Crp/Fnr family transcriptional regulator [Actinomycetota bacterium]